MVARAITLAFQGVDARRVEVEAQFTSGMSAFTIVGLGDKAVTEARERVRGALTALGLALPPERLVVNLAPADLPKEGAHYDLPIVLAVLADMGVIPRDSLMDVAAFGELGLDGSLSATPGVLPAAVAANGFGLAFVCPAACGPEAAWSGARVIPARHLLELINHLRGDQLLAEAVPGEVSEGADELGGVDLRDVRGQEQAKRALEIAAAGGHNLLLAGPPGAGKSMLAQRLPGLLPPLSPEELLEVSMIQSIAGLLERGRLVRARPYRAPHHNASMAAMVGGGIKAKPGEISLSHRGVLFLDELPEFHPAVLDSLRQPLETGTVTIARANNHVTYPARVQLVAAMNPCRCGAGPASPEACRIAPRCAESYQGRLSGPLLDRIDLQLDVPAVTPSDLSLPPSSEGTAEVAARVLRAREAQAERGVRSESGAMLPTTTNAELGGERLDRIAAPDAGGASLLAKAADALRLSARGYHRVLKVARTIADLDGRDGVSRVHIAEALSYRRAPINPRRDVSGGVGHNRSTTPSAPDNVPRRRFVSSTGAGG
jgi:magnesium chelatase family protein